MFCPIRKVLSFKRWYRLNGQTDDNGVIIFPVDFLPQVITNNVNSVVEEVLKKYPRFIYSRMIMLPVICDSQATIFTVINLIGVIQSEFTSRGISFILSLHPGPDDTRPNLSNISRRLRSFLNKAVQSNTNCYSDVKFTYMNMKIYKPNGKLINFFAMLLNTCNMSFSFFKCQSNIHVWIMGSQHSN